MTDLEQLAAKLRTFWLRDVGAISSSVDGTASDGSVILARTLFVPAIGGSVGINQSPSDNFALDIVGNTQSAGNIVPRAGNAWSLGVDGTPWIDIYGSTLHVGNLIAENKIATSGGRLVVSPSTKLILAVTAGATTIDVAANSLASGDRIYLEGVGKLEWMAVTSSATAVTNGYRYSVTRNLNGAGAQTWAAGDAVVNTGTTGNGFIDLYSRYGIPRSGQTATSRVGPSIAGNVRTGTAWDAIRERWAIGNLNGLYDYSSSVYGFAAGDPTAAWISADATNGIRFMNSATNLGQWTAAGGITIGEVAASKSNVAITSGALTLRNNTTERVKLTAAGVLTINDSGGAAVFTFDSSAGAEFTKPLTLGASGGIYQGSGTFASPATGLKIWNDSGVGRIAGYNVASANPQWYVNTDGKLYAGGGSVILDSDGLTLTNIGVGYSKPSAIKYGDKTNLYTLTSASGAVTAFEIQATGSPSYINLLAQGETSAIPGSENFGAIALKSSTDGVDAVMTLYSSGRLEFTGTANRVAYESASATIADRLHFVPTNADTAGFLGVLPSDSATGSIIRAYGGSNADSAPFIQFNFTGGFAYIASNRTGTTATVAAMRFAVGGLTAMQISTNRALWVGQTAASLLTDAAGNIEANASIAAKTSFVLGGASTGKATIQYQSTATNATLTLPTTTGTVALTSDVTTAVSGTTGTLAKFTAANTIGDSIVSESGTVATITGDLAFSGNARRISGEMASATHANRLLVTPSNANTVAAFGLIPSGTATAANFRIYNNNNPDIAQFANISCNSSNMFVASGTTTTSPATYVPMNFQTGGATRAIISTSGATSFNATALTLLTDAAGNVSAGGSIAATLSFLAASSAAPASPADGQFWNDSTQKAIIGQLAGVKQTLAGIIFTQTADKTITNTTTETTLMGTGVGTLTLPANFWTVGKTIRIRQWGYYTQPASTAITRTVKVKLGSTTLISKAVTIGAAAASNDGYQILFEMTCRTTGVSGTIYGQGSANISTGSYLVNTAATTVDTTAAAAIDMTLTWGSASSTVSITSTNMTVEVLN